MLKEFKEFALKGNVLDLAIAVVMGAAFNKIISSLVENIIMPLIGKIFGSVDFAKNGHSGVLNTVYLSNLLSTLLSSRLLYSSLLRLQIH